MTDKQTAEEYAKSFAYSCSCGIRGPMLAILMSNLPGALAIAREETEETMSRDCAELIRMAREEEREKNCKAVCPFCYRNVPLEFTKGCQWVHTLSARPECKASSIHALPSLGEEGEDGKG